MKHCSRLNDARGPLAAAILAGTAGLSAFGVTTDAEAAPRDEIEVLLSEADPPARFKDYEAQFSVRKVLFKWTVYKKAEGRTYDIAQEKQTIFDGDRMIGYIYDRNPVFGHIRLFSMHPHHVADINPEDWADATDFRNYARDYGEALTFGGVYDETNTEIRGGGQTITFVRTDICRPDGSRHRDSREVNTITLSVHPQLGYCLDRVRKWRVKPLPKDRHGKHIKSTEVGDLWGWGVVNPWPGEGTYTQCFFSPGASYRPGRRDPWTGDKKFALYWMNGPSVEEIRHGYHPRVRPNGLVGYLAGRENWGVAMVVVGSPDVGAAVCPAWGEFHAAGPDLPSDPDKDGYWCSTFSHRMTGLPPEIQEHIRANGKWIFAGRHCLAIRLDGEDFEDQPLPYDTPRRTLRFVGRGVSVSTEQAHSGKRSIVTRGIRPEELPRVHIHEEHPPVCFDPGRKYHLECWIYVEGKGTEAFVIGANELEVKDKMMFLRADTVGKSRTPSVRKPGKWQKVSLEFTAQPYGGVLAIGFVAIGPGRAFFDDFHMEKVGGE